MAVEQMSVGRSGRLGKEARWMNERGGEEEHIRSGTRMCVMNADAAELDLRDFLSVFTFAFVLCCLYDN